MVWCLMCAVINSMWLSVQSVFITALKRFVEMVVKIWLTSDIENVLFSIYRKNILKFEWINLRGIVLATYAQHASHTLCNPCNYFLSSSIISVAVWDREMDTDVIGHCSSADSTGWRLYSSYKKWFWTYTVSEQDSERKEPKGLLQCLLIFSPPCLLAYCSSFSNLASL